MITGHLGVAGAAHRASQVRTNTVTLLALLLASIAPDIVDVAYAVVGFCNPFGLFSHTLHAVVLEAAVVGAVAWLATGSRTMTLLFTSVVLLHLPADFITGHKLLIPGGELVGLQVYEKPLLDLVIELPLAAAGWWLLRRGGRAPRWSASRWALAAAVFLQVGVDVYDYRYHLGIKPNACVDAP